MCEGCSVWTHIFFVSGVGVTNVETSLVFSPKSFLPRSASANLTVYFHGRAHNLLEVSPIYPQDFDSSKHFGASPDNAACLRCVVLIKVDLHVENAEPLVKNFFGHQTHGSDGESAQSPKPVQPKEVKRSRRKTDDEKEKCLSSTKSYLDQARAMVRIPQFQIRLLLSLKHVQYIVWGENKDS